jgi:hypothetical protein
LHFHDRGEHGDGGRRAQLRREARACIEADAFKAKLALDAAEAKMLTRLASGGLCSKEAKAFLSEIPEVDQLMPVLNIEQLQLMEGSSESDVPF